MNALVVATSLYLVFAVSAQQNGDLRLVDGPSSNEGRVEVYYDGQWGTLCDDSWQRRDADVVCKQLGFEEAEAVYYRAKFGEGTGPIWIDDISCPSGASSILECNHNGWGVNNCGHREDASVKCKRVEPDKPAEMPVRISCPQHTQDGSCEPCPKKQHPSPGDCTPQVAVQGIVEAYYSDEWRPVSLYGWNDASARVVCGELGYPEAFGIPSMDDIWSNWHTLYCSCDEKKEEGSGESEIEVCKCPQEHIDENDEFRATLNSTWLKGLECVGSEGRLRDCYFREFGPNSNPSLIQVATVRCGFGPHHNCSVEPGKPAVKETYRTRGGAVPWSGRVEVNVGGEWGTVCDRDFDMREAHIVCKAMGYGTAKTYQVRGQSGRGTGKIHYSNLRCEGHEKYLGDCEHYSGYLAESCGHVGDVAVTCNAPQTCNKLSRVVTLQSPAYPYTNDFVEVKGPNGWGILCADTLTPAAADMVCLEGRSRFSAETRSGEAVYNGTRYRGAVFCSNGDEKFEDCVQILVKAETCSKGELVIHCSSQLPDLVPNLEVFQRSMQYYPYIDRLPMYYLRCAHEENCLSSSANGKSTNDLRHLLRFSSQTDNFGTADFRPILDRSQWEWHTCHAHFHSFEAFIHYDILNKTTGQKVAEGHKASFCLEDSTCSGSSPRYRCGTGHQGISKNCGDLYGRHLDCQWIDVTDVPPGTYELRQHVNPDRLSRESDYLNNIISCDITFFAGSTYFSVTNFRHSDH